MAKKEFDYQKARTELDELLLWFESSDIAVDEAIQKFQSAEELLADIEKYLSDTHAKIEQLTKKVSE